MATIFILAIVSMLFAGFFSSFVILRFEHFSKRPHGDCSGFRNKRTFLGDVLRGAKILHRLVLIVSCSVQEKSDLNAVQTELCLIHISIVLKEPHLANGFPGRCR